MLRSQLSEDLYRRCIKTYLERHPLGSVVTEDLNRVIEERSGRSFDQFFDQWVHHGGVPELGVEYSWDATTKMARVAIKQRALLRQLGFLSDRGRSEEEPETEPVEPGPTVPNGIVTSTPAEGRNTN